MKIGVISDTHGRINPKIFNLFKGVDLILHGGDVGGAEILADLEQIAPVHAVYGNMDSFPLVGKIPQSDVIEAKGIKIGLSHGGGSPQDIIERLLRNFAKENVKIIVYGHTHSPAQEYRGDILLFNPGCGNTSAGFIEISESGDFSTRIEEF